MAKPGSFSAEGCGAFKKKLLSPQLPRLPGKKTISKKEKKRTTNAIYIYAIALHFELVVVVVVFVHLSRLFPVALFVFSVPAGYDARKRLL